MEPSRRTMILSVVVFVLLLLLGIWWYFGFSIDFMQFFAAQFTPTPIPAETQPVNTNRSPTPMPPTVAPSPSGGPNRSPTPMPAVTQPPVAGGAQVACSPLTQNGSVGQAVTLTANGGAGLYSWYAPQGSPATQGTGAATFSVSYATAGTKKITVQAARLVNGQNDPANPVIDSVACTVIVQ